MATENELVICLLILTPPFPGGHLLTLQPHTPREREAAERAASALAELGWTLERKLIGPEDIL